MKSVWISVAAVAIGLISGCQCCPLTDHYGNAIDDINDTHVYFDRVYNPRFDITRMGKPDWCGPFNRLFCRRNCYNGCYDRYDDCNLYPPLTPYVFPSNVMPPPVTRLQRTPMPLDTEIKNADTDAPLETVPTPNSDQAPTPNPEPPPTVKEL